MHEEIAFAYDPQKVLVTINGERVHGFSADNKISIGRGLNGYATAKIYLQGTSPFVPELKKLLGTNTVLDVEYDSVRYEDALAFRADMVITGYEVDITNEVPIFIFHLKTK